MQYTVVENAGYEREKDIQSFATSREAWAWARQFYDDELESLHVEVRRDAGDEQTYDF